MLIWTAIGLIIGLSIAVVLQGGIYAICICVVFATAGLMLRFFTPYREAKRIAAYLMLGCAIGMCMLSMYSYFNILPAKSLQGTQQTMTVRVSDHPVKNDEMTVVDGKLQYQNKLIPVRLTISYPVDLKPGDKVTGEISLSYVGFDVQNSKTYHQGNHVLLFAYVNDGAFVTKAAKTTFSDRIANLRHRIHEIVNDIFPDDTEGFATALLLGDSSGLSVEDDNALKNSGVRHVIATSGLHVSILCGLLAMLFAHRRWPMALIGIPVLFLFAAVAGFTPSIVRACVMQALILMASCLGKDYDPPTSLAFAVMIILGADPLAFLSVSFQLSVGCVLGIQFFSEKTRMTFYKWEWLKEHSKGKKFSAKLIRWFVGSVSISLSAMSLTLPISAYYFGTVSTVSIITNCLTLWIINYVFYGIIFGCIFYLIYPPFAVALAWVISWLIRYVLIVSKILSMVPFAAVSTDNIFIAAWLFFAYGMFLLMLFSKKKHAILLLGCIGFGFIGAVTLSRLELKQDRFRVTVLDVGQGQCVILQNQESCYVVDCGGDSGMSAADKAASTLRTMGITKVDGLILTHFDVDHAGGAESFVSQMQTDRIYVPDSDLDNTIYLTLEENYPEQLSVLSDTCYLSSGDDYLTIYPQYSEKGSNESSMCILFQSGDYDILITGDLDAAGEKAFVDQVRVPDIEILVCGHHGAKTSSGLYFLNAIDPENVVISVGKNNRYGHPHRSTLDKLELFGCRIWRTDIHGTVVFRG